MKIQYEHSDCEVKLDVDSESESCAESLITLMNVAASNDEVPEKLTAFVRFLIGKWEADGKKLKDLSIAAGWPKSSMVNQIKAGSSVTEYTGARLAPPLGYRDFADLVVAAYAWWNGGALGDAPASTADSPLVEATRLARKYGITQAQIERGIGRVAEEERPTLDELAWLSTFQAERSMDLRIEAARRAANHREAATEASTARKQAEIRGEKQKLEKRLTPPPRKRSSQKRTG